MQIQQTNNKTIQSTIYIPNDSQSDTLLGVQQEMELLKEIK